MLVKRILPFIALVLIIGALVTAAGCAVISGSGDLETRELGNTDFTRVEIGYAFDVEIYQDEGFLVRLTLDDNLYEYLDVSQSGSTLKISMKPGYVFAKATQRAVITLPDLEHLELSGASQGDVHGFISLDNLDIEISGASQMDISDVSSPNIHIQLSGASKAEGNLTMTDGEFKLSGASQLTFEGSAEVITVDASGASRADLIIRNANAAVNLC